MVSAISRTPLTLSAAALAAAALSVVAVGGPAAAESRPGREPVPTEPSITGSVQLLRLDGQDVRFSFDVQGFYTDARGSFSFVHRAANGQVAWAKVTADCLISGGPVTVVTGFVTDTNRPELKGKRKGVTVYDNGHHDRLGYSWPVSHDIDVPQCMSMAPFETVRTGDLTVRDWTPPLPTAAPAPGQGGTLGAGPRLVPSS